MVTAYRSLSNRMWFEKKMPRQRLRINNVSGYNSSNTTMTVDATSDANGITGAYGVRKGSQILVESTGEILYVSADPSSDTSITVVRGFGTTSAASIADDAWLTVIGTIHEQGGALPSAIGYDPTEYNNYCQIFRSPLFMTRTAMKTRLRTGDQVKEAKREALMLLNNEKEKAFIFGELKASTGTKGQPMYATRGIVSHISTYASSNVIDAGGVLSESEWDGYLEQVFRYGSSEKLALVGSGAMAVLAQLAKNGGIQLNAVAKDDAYGMSLVQYITPFGVLYLKTHPIFSDHPVWRYNALVIDTANIVERYVDDIQYLKNRQTAGDDAQADEYLNEAGIETHFAETHAYIKNITSFAP